MPQDTLSDSLDQNKQVYESLLGAKFLRAYLECNDEMQEVVRETLDILSDPETDEDDRQMSLATLADAIFPNHHNGQLGLDYEESEREAAREYPEFQQVVDEMDREEASFSDNLQRIMSQKNVSQTELADKIGVGQPAISNMLSRSCRPQQRTIQRLAQALEVHPDKLWPRES
jgi:lambda repressor-like predicted transcriptional regulator